MPELGAMSTPAQRWSALHHGIDPAAIPLVSGWLRLMWAGGRVLARAGVPPTAVTAAGVVLASSAVVAARPAPYAAAAAVIGAAVCDGLDGATAVMADRATRHGALADAIADRICDAAFAAVLWRRGAPPWLAASAAGTAWGVDGLRRVRRIPARITVAERPTFTVCAAIACASAAITPALRRSGWPGALSAAVWVAAGAIGLAQLARTPGRPAGPSS